MKKASAKAAKSSVAVSDQHGYRTLHVGGERIDLAWLGTNHTPDNIYIHFPTTTP